MAGKKITALVLMLVLLCTLTGVYAQQAQPVQVTNGQNALVEITQPDLEVPCRNAILVSADTGDVLYEKGADDQVCIASITKVMTLLLTFEAIEKGKITLQDTVPVSAHAYGMGGSQIWLEPREIFTLEEMLKAICISSANDAAVAVAEYVGGSEPVFVQMMNDRAAELGMTNTHFNNACGLDAEGHYSSARDVAVMSIALLAHPAVLHYSGIWMDTLRGGETQLTNTNKMLKNYEGTIGLKTGTTGKAGVCISACAEREGTTMLAVVLGSDNSATRFEAARALLDYGFANYKAVDFPTPVGSPAYIEVEKGQSRQTALQYNTPQKLLVQKNDSEKLSATADLPEIVEAPVTAGTPVGSITVQAGDTHTAQYSICVKDTVEKMDFDAGFDLLFSALKCL